MNTVLRQACRSPNVPFDTTPLATVDGAVDAKSEVVAAGWRKVQSRATLVSATGVLAAGDCVFAGGANNNEKVLFLFR